MRVYTQAYAAVRIMAPLLDPLVVTQCLQLPPDIQHRAGEPRLIRTRSGKVESRTPYHSGLWSMSSKEWVDSPRLETHLAWLLTELEPKADVVRQFCNDGVTVDFFCYSVGRRIEPPSIPSLIRERAQALGASIEIDHYLVDHCEGE